MNKPQILETVKNSYCFLSDYKFYAFRIFLYLLPAFLVLHALNFWLVLDTQLHRLPPLVLVTMPPRAIFTAYEGIIFTFIVSTVVSVPIYCAQIIAWHRAYLLGPDDSNRVNPLRMNPEEREFMGKYVLYMLLLFAAMFAAGIVAGGGVYLLMRVFGLGPHLGIALLVVILSAGYFTALVGVLRCSFYFPAKATGGYLSFRESFRISKGLGFRLMITNLLCWIPILVFNAIYTSLIPPVTLSPMSDVLGIGLFSPATVVSYFLQLPPGLFAVCLALFVTVNNLSQYYRWIEENRMGGVQPEVPDMNTVGLPRSF
jgi:hypothetical protein